MQSNYTTEKTVVRYDKSRKVWMAINGQVKEFPAAQNGKQAAMLTALQHDHPAIFSVICDVIAIHGGDKHLTDRLIKAAQLLTKGRVYQGHVKSQAGEKVYNVTFSVVYNCDCPDFQDGGAESGYGRLCKHSAAQLLAYLLNLDLPTLPPVELEPELAEIIDQGLNDRRPDQNALPQWAGQNGDITDYLG